MNTAATTRESETDREWNAKRYATEARFVIDGGAPLVELLAPRAGERVLDLGSGTGALTRAIADRGARVVGLDASTAMLAEARSAYPDLDFRAGRAEALAFEHEFDAVFSNATLHWVHDAAGVARGIRRALVPGGRFVAEFGGHGNVAAVRAAVNHALETLALPGMARPFSPWYFPRLGAYASLLEEHGFDVQSAWWFARPSPMPDRDGQSGVAAWLAIFARDLVASVPEPARGDFTTLVEEHARPALFRDGVWWIDYVRLRVVATTAR
ncbi:MAG TPA: methyltransferase domain-containing protein [Polyangiaceae bacterium]|nr:methyltransferase domain-containing protein [Polyangiaceae bacterium]